MPRRPKQKFSVKRLRTSRFDRTPTKTLVSWSPTKATYFVPKTGMTRSSEMQPSGRLRNKTRYGLGIRRK